MHEREESTRKLACSVDILLQQQSLITGKVANPNEVSMMSRREILKTANDIVKGFNKMRLQLLNMDLKVDEGQKHEGVAFEIPFDDVGGSKKCKKKPAIASLQKKDLKAENQMVALKLEEKQRKAAKRRLVCILHNYWYAI
jgi:hypothetical protein